MGIPMSYEPIDNPLARCMTIKVRFLQLELFLPWKMHEDEDKIFILNYGTRDLAVNDCKLSNQSLVNVTIS